MALSESDHKLSMQISPRRRRHAEPEVLRTLMVHRLTNSEKLVLRRSLGSDNVSGFCEPCGLWTLTMADDPEYGVELSCTDCRRRFRFEFAIYEEVD